MNQRASLSVVAFLLAAPSAVLAAQALHTVGGSSVKFEAAGPAGLKINGETSGVQTVERDGKFRITAPTTAFHTGIGLRDKHLRDYLESDKHGEAVLVVDRAKVTLPGTGKVEGVVAASLTLHGVTRPTNVTYTVQRSGAGYQVEGHFDVNILDYQIKKPCYLGVCVGDVVKVDATFAVQAD